MKATLKPLAMTALMLVTALPAWALDKGAGKAAFDNYGCASCHQMTDKMVGPSLKDIAKRYKGKKANAEIAVRIREGSEGRWGDMPHPALDTVTAEDARLLADWILAGAR